MTASNKGGPGAGPSKKSAASKGSPGASKKSAARAKAAAMREEQLRKQRRTERLVRGGVAAAVVLAIVIVFIVVQANRSQVDEGAARPAGISEAGGGFAYGAESGSAPTLDIWGDFQCPFCKQFEEQSGETINQLADEGMVRVVFHPVSFIGAESKTAANAFGCAIDEDKGEEFIPAAYAEQRAENSGVFTEDKLIAIGDSVGASGDAFDSCVQDNSYAEWVDDVAARANDTGITQTPTVKLDGETLSDLSPAGIEKAIDDAAAQ